MHGVSPNLQDPSAEAHEWVARPHLYVALTDSGRHGDGQPPQGASAAIWQAIDRLRAEGGRAAEVFILEQLSIEVHRLSFALKASDPRDETAARGRISALTEDWLSVARLRA
jgi:hypothetical protein